MTPNYVLPEGKTFKYPADDPDAGEYSSVMHAVYAQMIDDERYTSEL